MTPTPKAKHTPENWYMLKHNWSDISIYDKNDNIVATISIKDEATEKNQSVLEKIALDNARLISSAPELLRALQRICHEWPESRDGMDYQILPFGIKGARAAIAKATGGKGE